MPRRKRVIVKDIGRTPQRWKSLKQGKLNDEKKTRAQPRVAREGTPKHHVWPMDEHWINVELLEVAQFSTGKALTMDQCRSWLKRRIAGYGVGWDEWGVMIKRHGEDAVVTQRVDSIRNKVARGAAIRRGGGLPDFRSHGSGQSRKAT